MDEVLVNIADGKTRRTTQLMRLARNRTRGKVGPYITKVKTKISHPQQLVDYLETKNNSGRNVFAYAKEGNLRFLKTEYAAAKTANNNVVQLFEELFKTLWIYPRYKAIVNHLKDLASTQPRDFVRYDGLFTGLQQIITDGTYQYNEPVSHILEKISITPEHKSMLKTAFEKFASTTTQNTERLRSTLNLVKVLRDPIFDMPSIMASDKSQVYALMGHGCVYVDDKRIEVPPGVIWIENALCGRFSYTDRIGGFITTDVKLFLEETPIPTDEASRTAYRAFLFKNLPEYSDVKFPGETIAAGRNNLYGELKDDADNPTGTYFKSGIQRLYKTHELNPDVYTTLYTASEEDFESKAGIDTFFANIYKDSIYPTVEYVVNTDTRPTGFNYNLEFEELFSQIQEQAYEVGDLPLILINAGCRVPCGQTTELTRPALRRANSLEAQNEIVRTLPNDELRAVKTNGRTRLMILTEEGAYGAAKRLVERLAATAITPVDFFTFLKSGHETNFFDILAKSIHGATDTDLLDLKDFIDLKLTEIIPEIDPVLLTQISSNGQTLLIQLIQCQMVNAVKKLVTELEATLSYEVFRKFINTHGESPTALDYARDIGLREGKETDLSRFILSKLWSSARREFASPAPPLPSIENRLRAAKESKGGFLKRTRRRNRV
jgi:hypothetical protein